MAKKQNPPPKPRHRLRNAVLVGSVIAAVTAVAAVLFLTAALVVSLALAGVALFVALGG